MSKFDKNLHAADLEGFENGPIDKRGCQDIICCIIFVLASIAMLGLFINGVTNA